MLLLFSFLEHKDSGNDGKETDDAGRGEAHCSVRGGGRAGGASRAGGAGGATLGAVGARDDGGCSRGEGLVRCQGLV